MNKLDKSLILAAEMGKDKKVQRLLKAGAIVSDELPLRSAAENGHTKTVQVLLEAFSAGANRGIDVHSNNDSALRMAAHRGHAETVQVLLRAGANVHAVGNSALFWAARRDHTETVHILLRAGADPSKVTPEVLKKYLTTKFLFSLPDDIIARIKTSHPEIEKLLEPKYNLSKYNEGEARFNVKISLADLYYRPGEPGYYRAISDY